MKRILKLTAVVLVLLFLCGCSGSNYKYVEKGEESYLVLGYSNLDTSNFFSVSGSGLAPKVYFNSVAEMKSDIQNGNFTAAEFAEIARFDKDSKGNVSVCSLDNLYEVTKPDSYVLEKISWSGTHYSFRLARVNRTAILSVRSRVDAERIIQRYFEELRSITEYDRKEIDEEVNGTAYYFNFTGYPGKRVNYTFTHNGIEYYVSEGYDCINGNYAISDINVVGISNVACFSILFDNVSSVSLPRLSMDEISQFSLKKYVETEVS